jgi:Spy/CpxP family protein refolding chaperone
MNRMLLSIALLLGVTTAVAQEHSPYAGFEQRSIKTLSVQQIADLKAGRGMSFALAAELNGFPGPLHVLDLADKIELTAEQRRAVEALYAAMKAEAVPIGERLIGQEAELDRLFASRSVTPASLTAATEAIGQTQAALRRAHLAYHLSTAAILTPEQARRYAELRGYAGAHPQPGHAERGDSDSQTSQQPHGGHRQ